MTIRTTRPFTDVFLVGFSIAAFGVSLAYAEQRTWTGRNGKQLKAELVQDEGERILLRDADGKNTGSSSTTMGSILLEPLITHHPLRSFIDDLERE
jgi:hypothetical protein